jgi:hypothetical protein
MKLRNLTFALLILGLTCCSDRDDRPSERGGSATQLAEPDSEIDQDLMVCLLQAKNFHHKAKVYMGDADLDDAIDAVRSILTIQCPDAPEAEDVRMDAEAMLAKLLLLQGKPEDAMKEVDGALGKKTRDSFFVANLFTVKGEIFEAEAADQADIEKQRALKRQALDAYDQSNQIIEPLQKKLYEDVKGAR